jgi:hypothetical protein
LHIKTVHSYGERQHQRERWRKLEAKTVRRKGRRNTTDSKPEGYRKEDGDSVSDREREREREKGRSSAWPHTPYNLCDE